MPISTALGAVEYVGGLNRAVLGERIRLVAATAAPDRSGLRGRKLRPQSGGLIRGELKREILWKPRGDRLIIPAAFLTMCFAIWVSHI
jgi:hypothetical protein